MGINGDNPSYSLHLVATQLNFGGLSADIYCGPRFELICSSWPRGLTSEPSPGGNLVYLKNVTALFRNSILLTALFLSLSGLSQAQPNLALSSASVSPGGTTALNLS